MSKGKFKLTQYSHGGGCGCKIAPRVLEKILKTESVEGKFTQLLVGNSTQDDAAVYQINDREAIISTTDFFMPIVDDPYIFGKVAAANAISDVYAMGGNPLMAIAILGWPVNTLPVEVAREVMEGARAICQEAGIPLAGGHSIDTPEPVFGLAVTGKVAIKHLKQNNRAREGDYFFLTKPLGVGVYSTAAKKDAISEEDLTILYAQLVKLNDIGAALSQIETIHAMTDVTGFGLAGHLLEMAENSGLSANLTYALVPKLQALEKYLRQDIIPGAAKRNWIGYRDKIHLKPDVNEVMNTQILSDPQTNGGLLVSVAPQGVKAVQELLIEHGYDEYVEPIGRFVQKEKKILIVQ